MKAQRKRRRPPHPGEEERIAIRRVKALDLRKTGLSYRAIAKRLGVDVETAWNDVQAELTALRAHTTKTAEEIKELELRRLDDLWEATWKKAKKGDHRAAAVLVRIQQRRATLLGLDAPTKIAPTDPTGTKPYEDAKQQLLGKLARLGGSGGAPDVSGESDRH